MKWTKEKQEDVAFKVLHNKIQKTLQLLSYNAFELCSLCIKECVQLFQQVSNYSIVLSLTGLNKNDCDAYRSIILHPLRIPEMQVVSITDDGESPSYLY